MHEPTRASEDTPAPEITNAVCSACGAPLHCGAVTGEPTCWCASLPAVAPVPGTGCLCAPCLRRRVRELKVG